MINEIRKLGRDFSKAELARKWDELDRQNPEHLKSVLKAAARNGALSFLAGQNEGGAGLSVSDYCSFVEEVSRACPGAGMLFAAHAQGIAPLLLLSDNDTARGFLSGIAASEAKDIPVLFTAAIYEDSDRTTNPDNIKTEYVEKGETVIVTGAKSNVLCGASASYYAVAARCKASGAMSIIMMPSGSGGISVKEEKKRIGLRFCPVCDVDFKNAATSNKYILLKDAQPEFFRKWTEYSDPALAAVATGIAVEARVAALKYSVERYQGGKQICDHDLVRMMLADMESRTRAARALAYSGEGGLFASGFAAEAAEKTCLDAVQIHGGYGYMEDYRVERYLRDAKALTAIGGSASRGIEYVGLEIEKMK